jgi:hypothetical protein
MKAITPALLGLLGLASVVAGSVSRAGSCALPPRCGQR